MNNIEFEDHYLLIDTKDYGTIRFYIQSPSLPSLNFEHNNCNLEILKVFKQAQIITSDRCSLAGYPVDNDFQFTLNRVAYHNLSLSIRVRQGKVDYLNVKANHLGKYRMHSDFTTSANQKLCDRLTKELSPVIETHIEKLVEITITSVHDAIASKLDTYKSHVEQSLDFFNYLLSGQDPLNLIESDFQNAIDSNNPCVAEILNELFTSITTNDDVIDFTQLSIDWQSGSLSIEQFKDQFRRLMMQYLRYYQEYYHTSFKSEFTQSDFNNWLRETKIFHPLVLRVFKHYKNTFNQEFLVHTGK